jgi:hypothetical protein
VYHAHVRNDVTIAYEVTGDGAKKFVRLSSVWDVAIKEK